MRNWLHTLRDRLQEGQGLVEYALSLVLVAVVGIVILALLGPAIGNIFSNIVNGLNGNVPQTGGGLILLF
jgi:pilus assembly protein Flp/PilA